ncbi:MAG: hypothetical protein WD269_07340 [Acidimicrobiia bacterium]
MGLAIGVVAANLFNMGRFWRVNQPWRQPITILHLVVIAFPLVLMALDISKLVSGS